MKTFDSADIRNVVVVGHGGSGKTTLSEAMLFASGAIARMGSVTEGTSNLDFVPEETKRKVSVYLTLAQFEANRRKVNLLDAPGAADFYGEVLCGLRAADFALLVINAQVGVEPDTDRVCETLDEQEKPRFIAINMMDKEQADFEKALKSVNDRLSNRAAPLFYPIGQGATFKGVINVLESQAYEFDGKDVKPIPVPEDLKDLVEDSHNKMVELAAESDDALLEKYLETMELTPEETLQGLRLGIAKGTVYPAIPVAAEKSLGISKLVELITEYGPSPLDVPGPLLKGSEERLVVDPKGPAVGLIFKVTTELMAQKFDFIRVYRGSFAQADDLLNTTRDSYERLGQLYNFVGKERLEMERAVAGDICAAAKLKVAGINDTLAPKAHPVILEPIAFPAPLNEMAISAKSKGDDEKVGSAFHKMHEEDLTFVLEVQAELHQTVLKTMGDQHQDVILERLKRKYNLEVDVARPKVPFRETIRGNANVAYRHKKQTGGAGQFADVSIKVEPTARGEGFDFVDEISGGVIPSKFIPAVEKGIVETMHEGVLAGYQVVDVRVRLHFGGYHDVDSSETAFKIAGSMAFRNGMKEAQPILLEPIMSVEIRVPEDFMGDVMGDVSSRRGRIMGMEPDGKYQTVKATIPQIELHRYSTTLRSLTQGRARYTARFLQYEEVPRDAADKLIETLKKEREAVA